MPVNRVSVPAQRLATHVLLLGLLLSVPFLAVHAARPASPIRPAAAARGDGHLDLAIGVPGEDVGDSAFGAGAVNVIYARANGLYFSYNALWHQDNLPGASEAETFDGFGHALAAGDFDGDGWDDLAVGVPGEDVYVSSLLSNAGIVDVLYGSPTGLATAGHQIWCQGGCDGLLDTAEENDDFGSALATGDFNGDGYDDLAVGVPGEDVGTDTDAGAVNVVYGSPNGLSILYAATQFWHQDSPNVEGGAEPYDGFGSALAAGDFDGDGYDDLAVGVRYEDVGSIENAGAVNVLYGTSDGLSAAGDQIWDQGPLLGDPAEQDVFGFALAAGHLNGDARADLAIGVRNEDVGAATAAGAVNVLYGSPTGLTTIGEQYWNQDTGLDGMAETNDFFGAALAIGDLNCDGYGDLAVGVPREDVGTVVDAGAINLIFGTAGGLSAAGNIVWDEDDFGSAAAETDDQFGFALAAGDLNADGCDDLAAGVPYQHVSGWADAGAVDVFYGAGGWPGATVGGISQDSSTIPGEAAPDDHFGLAVAMGDWRGFRVYLPLSFKQY